eukprot:2991891-Rhodomonas_salina.1
MRRARCSSASPAQIARQRSRDQAARSGLHRTPQRLHPMRKSTSHFADCIALPDCITRRSLQHTYKPAPQEGAERPLHVVGHAQAVHPILLPRRVQRLVLVARCAPLLPRQRRARFRCHSALSAAEGRRSERGRETCADHELGAREHLILVRVAQQRRSDARREARGKEREDSGKGGRGSGERMVQERINGMFRVSRVRGERREFVQ